VHIHSHAYNLTIYTSKIYPLAMTADNNQQETGDSCESDDTGRFFMNTIAFSSRWFFLLAVIGSSLISITLFVYGFILSLTTIVQSFSAMDFSVESMKIVMAVSIQIIDLFLVATVFYVVSLGFYELFIAKAPLPGWLKICNLDDLKTKVLGLVIIALSVLFLGAALTWDGSSDILAFGLATSSGIIAIAVYIWVKH
jgi:uncharacterized membrane protein YqhA